MNAFSNATRFLLVRLFPLALPLFAQPGHAGPVVTVDRGIFPDLDAAITFQVPGTPNSKAVRAVPLHSISATEIACVLGRVPKKTDADRDGLPDAFDVLLGARKLVANGAAYTEGYVRMPFPGGDVPRDQGVCTDTVIRTFRNAGFDLQKLIAEDIRRSPQAYPRVKTPDTNIDHRRVPNLLRWFERHMTLVAKDAPVLPGDVVFLDTFPAKPGPDHVGIASERRTADGRPLIINNWTVGYREGEMDLLSFVPVTHRFRVP